MSTYIEIPITGIKKKKRPPTRTYAVDFDKGQIKGKVEGINAVRQYIHKALLTPRFMCLIYSNQYGSEIKQTIIAEDATQKFVKAELPRIIEDAIIHDDRILSVGKDDFQYTFLGDSVNVMFTVQTIYGILKVEEEIKNV